MFSFHIHIACYQCFIVDVDCREFSVEVYMCINVFPLIYYTLIYPFMIHFWVETMFQLLVLLDILKEMMFIKTSLFDLRINLL